jgi:hypothetical protein
MRVAQRIPEDLVWHEVLVMRAPVSVDAIPAVTLEHVSAVWTDPRSVVGGVTLTAETFREIAVRHWDTYFTAPLNRGGMLGDCHSTPGKGMHKHISAIRKRCQIAVPGRRVGVGVWLGVVFGRGFLHGWGYSRRVLSAWVFSRVRRRAWLKPGFPAYSECLSQPILKRSFP